MVNFILDIAINLVKDLIYGNCIRLARHPFEQPDEFKKQNPYGIPLFLRELLDTICDQNPDYKPKQMKIHLEELQRQYKQLEIDIKNKRFEIRSCQICLNIV